MNILAISQVYWPDTASVSQHLVDLLKALSTEGHGVTVITSRVDYENRRIKYAAYEERNNVKIIRIRNTAFGKSSKIFRLFDFVSFNILILFKLLFIPKNSFDLMIGLTQPPLISYFGIIIAKMKQWKFIYWTMDLQPELSILAGYIKKGSFLAKFLQNRGDYIFKHADHIITLDKYMRQHIYDRTLRSQNISIIPVWPVMEQIYHGERLTNPFRLENSFGDKIVIMYSGNHATLHPLDTLLHVALSLRNNKKILFVHIGSGVRLKEVIKHKELYSLDNIVILPYQPRELIYLSLGSSDMQVVILGNDCVGYSHPNKIYGAMFIGKPILYIGPQKSHISDILDECPGNISIDHGHADDLAAKITEFTELSEGQKNLIGERNMKYAQRNFHPKVLIKEMVNIIAHNSSNLTK